MFPILLLVIIGLIFIYLTGQYNENYWRKRGVTFYEKNKVLGIFWDFLTTEKALFEVLSDLYTKYENEPAVGIGSLMTPSLFVIDPQNVQHITQTDSQSFNHRGVTINKGDLLADNLLFMNGPRWKLMRQKMSPLFTATKLKNMFYIIDKSAQDFVAYLKENPENLKGNGFDTMNEFCSAAIAAAVFGIGTESTFKSPFLKMARDAVRVNWRTNLRFAVLNTSETLSRSIGLKLFKEQEPLFIDAIKQVLRARENDNVKKHDFADICVSLQKAGTMKDDETGQELEPSDELLAAQGFFYFIAGVEPTASGLFGALIELGKNPEILEKLQKEIDETFEKHNGIITYDVISEMKYLDQVLSEALRMHAPIGFIGRKCVSDSVLPVGNIKVSSGTKIYIPVFSMHYNPKFFPEPEKFDPDRFSAEKRTGSEVAYLPFGKGARICIGMRYARLQVLTGLLHLLRHYRVLAHRTPAKRKYAKGQFQLRQIDTDIELIPRDI
ncbi:cytochrome P450 6B5-like [Cydia pomonella]|uniref:cytochrome P450 6B5-like n=1 Tax=Cydia pomonella TaxID=82600 RepID=UPI002ADE5AE4|nr:cytochrome P450 6B5-like [Cydia pomonella]